MKMCGCDTEHLLGRPWGCRAFHSRPSPSGSGNDPWKWNDLVFLIGTSCTAVAGDAVDAVRAETHRALTALGSPGVIWTVNA